MKAIFVTDLHGNLEKYEKLSDYIKANIPEVVFIGGDILPNYMVTDPFEFINNYLRPSLTDLKNNLAENYPLIFLITGNDDPAMCLDTISELETIGLLYFLNSRVWKNDEIEIIGYHFVPPTPFYLKDSEKYDVSRFVPRGTVSPEEGIRTVAIAPNLIKFGSIKNDLEELSEEITDFRKTICLFHTPPYDTNLDKMIGKNINGINEIISAGSFAVRRFIEKYQPLITLHGHIHESSEISGKWMDRIGDTYCFNAAYNGNELSIAEFDTDDPENAGRILI